MLDDNKKVDDGTEEMVDGVPASVADAIDKANDDNAADTDDQYEDADADDKGKVDDEASVAGDTDLDEEDDTDTDTDEENDDDETVVAEGIEVLGYDAEMVQKLNDVDPNIVKDIRALLESGEVKESSEEDSELVPEKIEKVETEGLISEEAMAKLEKENPTVAAAMKGLNATVEKLTGTLNTVAEADAKRAEQATNREAYDNFRDTNSRLDKLAKEHPILGQYDKLPLNGDGVPDERNRSVRARAKVWGQARALQATGEFGSFSESLETAINLFEGDNAEKKATRKVAGELRDRSKQITTRPNRNKHAKKQPKPGTDAAMEKVIDDAFKKAGVKA